VPLRFGTDGVRGTANRDLTPELVLALGRAAARVLGGGGQQRFVVGRDTRLSGPMIQAALMAGLASEGVGVIDAGVLPTPGIAWLSAADGIPGAVISASHNPFPDNGIKFFAVGGRKLTDEVERHLERELDALISTRTDPAAPTGPGVGQIVAGGPQVIDRYAASVAEALAGDSLQGMRLVVDCANGAAGVVAPRVLRHLGATVEVIADQPDGRNINAGCGSTHPSSLQAAVVAARADAGLAFDGDADRVLAVDERGRLVDGDYIVAICALDLDGRGRLKESTVVVTVMTNLGFRRAMDAAGIRVVETAVGDRYVLEALERDGLSLGGEQSGHVIFRDVATTGDGLLTAVQLLDVVRRSGRSLADLADAAMTRLPQVLRNVRLPNPVELTGLPELWDEVAAVEAELGDRGRVLIRPSGTEPLVRVMVESATEELASDVAARLCGVIDRLVGGHAGP
jgi:phosphoglucosamine mutase